MAAIDLESATKAYFDAWNAHDVPRVTALMADDVYLRDWDVRADGKDKVGEANGNIFKNVPAISIDVLTIHVSAATNTAIAEIHVNLNDDDKTVLLVTDVIEFDAAGKIKAVRAYKG